MHGDLRGFYGAPVTYAFSLAVGAASSASLLFDRGRIFMLERDAVLSRMQYWRLFSSQFAFHHGLVASIGLYTIFQFRVLERQMGSRKFGSTLVFVLLVSGALEMAALLSTPSVAKLVPGGPYAILGAFSVFFNKFVPKLQPRALSFYGLHFSDKSTTYLLQAVMLVRDVNSLIPFLGGSLLGLLFSSTPLSRLRLPSFMCSLFGVFHPLFEVVPASAVALQRQRRALEAQRRLRRNRPGHPLGAAAAAAAAAANGQGFRDQLLPGAGGVMAGPVPAAAAAGGMMPPQAAAAPPSEDAVEQLMALGFDRERALQALQTTSNNVEAAANRLLNGL